MSSGDFEEAKKCLDDCIGMQDKAVLLHGSFDSEYRRCYGEELMADLIKAEQGIEAAEEYYLSAVRRYEKCGEKYSEESALQAPRNIYSKLRTAYLEAGNDEKCKIYLNLRQTELLKLCEKFRSVTYYKFLLSCCSETIRYCREYKTSCNLYSSVCGVLEKLDEAITLFPDESKFHGAIRRMEQLWRITIHSPEDILTVSFNAKAFRGQVVYHINQYYESQDAETLDIATDKWYEYIDYIDEQERFVKYSLERGDRPKELLIGYVKLIIEEYSDREGDVGELIVSVIGEDEIKEKLDYYNNLLAELTAENPS